MNRTIGLWLGICIVCACVAARAASGSGPTGTRFHNEEYGFSVQIPAGYVEAPEAVLAVVQQQVNRLEIEGEIEVMALYLRGLDGTVPVSGIQVQAMHHPKGRQFTEREMREFIAGVTGVDEHKIRQLMRGHADPGFSDMRISDVDFDEEGKCLVYTARAKVPNFGDMRVRSTNHFGQEGVMSVSCWTLEGDYAAHEKVFEGTLDSFAFDPGKEYQVAEWFEKPAVALVVIIVAGAVIGLVLRRS